jgi:hypothetical protein
VPITGVVRCPLYVGQVPIIGGVRAHYRPVSYTIGALTRVIYLASGPPVPFPTQPDRLFVQGVPVHRGHPFQLNLTIC